MKAKTEYTQEQRDEMKVLLNKIAALQADFWDTLSEFEGIADIELESTSDYTGYTEPTDEDLDGFLEAYGDGEEQ